MPKPYPHEFRDDVAALAPKGDCIGTVSLTVFLAVFISRFRRPGIGRRR